MTAAVLHTGDLVVCNFYYLFVESNPILCTEMTIVLSDKFAKLNYQQNCNGPFTDNKREFITFKSIVWILNKHVTAAIFRVSGHVHTLCAYFYG